MRDQWKHVQHTIKDQQEFAANVGIVRSEAKSANFQPGQITVLDAVWLYSTVRKDLIMFKALRYPLGSTKALLLLHQH